MTSQAIKCQKCRYILLDESCVLLNSSLCDPKKCETYDIKRFIYISEDKAPSWVKEKIENEEWTKGKLHCQKCNNRIGSFDYISGRKCDCRSTVIPPVHLVSSQIDRPVIIPNIK